MLFHTDAVQAVGKVPINVEEMGIDLLSLSGHKMYGPKGVGALYVRRQGPTVRLAPLFDGGGHERGRRSGTLPVPLIVGLGRASELCQEEMATERERLLGLRERLWSGIQGELDGVTLNGHPTERLPHLVCVGVEGVEPQAVLLGLDRAGIAAHSGSSCSSESLEPSPVLEAMGVDAHHSLRLSVGWSTKVEDIDAALEALPKILEDLRSLR